MVRGEAAHDLRDHAGGEAQQAGEAVVHAGWRDVVVAEDVVRIRAGDQARAADRVAADVHQRAAVERGIQADVAPASTGRS